jgi:DNA ligase-1
MLVEEWEAQKCTRPLSERLAMLEATIGQAKDSIAVVVDHEVARTFEDVEQLYESYLEDGFEGSMLKDPDGGYVFKKSWDWIKVKPEEDAEYLCIGLQEGRPDTRWVGTTGALILKTADGKEFNCAGMKASRRDQFWNNPDTVLDKWITVKYQNLTKNGIPRFPEYKAVRDYE